MSSRAPFLLTSALLAGCAAGAGDGQIPTRIDARLDADNDVEIRTLPSASCVVRDPTAGASSSGLSLNSDDEGALSFSFRPHEAGSLTKLNVECTDASGARDTRVVELRGDPDVAPAVAPPPPGRMRAPLANPDALSTDELHAAGFPSRPDPIKSPEEYAGWREYVSRPAIEVAACPATSNRLAFSHSTSNWAGYGTVAQGLCLLGGNCFITSPLLSVVSEWNVPAVYAVPTDYGTQYDANFWIGLGDTSAYGGGMWQGGADNVVMPTRGGEVTTTKVWYELVVPGCTVSTGSHPCVPEIDYLAHRPSANDHMVAELWFAGSNSPCTTGLTGNDNTQYLGYLFSDETAGWYWTGCRNVQELFNSTGRVGPSGITGGTAEWVVERSYYGYLPPLASFYPVRMANAQGTTRDGITTSIATRRRSGCGATARRAATCSRRRRPIRRRPSSSELVLL